MWGLEFLKEFHKEGPLTLRNLSLTILVSVFLPFLGLAQTQPPHIMVIAHRGAHEGIPSNTLLSLKEGIRLGVDYVECDIRTTADHKLVIMHNETVNGTTNGTGKIRDMTLRQIRKLDVGIKVGPQFAGTKVPTLDEMLKVARGKIGIYADTKDASPQALLGALRKYGMLSHTVIYGYHLAFFEGVAKLDPDAWIMPESRNATVLRSLLHEFHLQYVAFSASDFQEPLISMTKQAGAKIYVDRLGPADNPESWQAAVDAGADGIQTDHPAELLKYLRDHGYHL
jgi:glycerophosphoryl diester phosphodiesterase